MGNAASVACIAGASAGLAVVTSYELLLKRGSKGTPGAGENALASVHSEVRETSRKVEQLMELTQNTNRVLAKCIEMSTETSTERVDCAVVAFQDIAKKLNGNSLTWVSPGIEDMNANVRRVLELATHANSIIDEALCLPQRDQLSAVMRVLDSIEANTKRVFDLVANTRNKEQAQKAMVALTNTVTNLENIVTQKLPTIESAILETNKRIAATNEAVGLLPDGVDKTVKKYSTILHDEHEQLYKLLSPGV
jgi:hypothetical protein